MLMSLGHAETGTWGSISPKLPVLSGESGQWREAAIQVLVLGSLDCGRVEGIDCSGLGA